MNSFLLHHARLRTMDPARPAASALAVRDGVIAAVGTEVEVRRTLDVDAPQVDAGGRTVLPAFIDAHCHLLAYAASLRAVDCTGARSIAEIQRAIGERARSTPSGQWIRAFGYEETALAERRHPTRADLDAAAPHHPVRLVHRSGHASVLNTRALQLAGITITSEEPPGGVIERDLTTGEPNGVLLGMERQLDALLPPLPEAELREAVREASRRLLRTGVTALHDASVTNGRAQWDLFVRLMDNGDLPLAVTMLEGVEHLGELPEQACAGRLRRGPVKIVIEEIGDELAPDEDELRRRVEEAHARGRQVAVHAVGERAVRAAVEAFETALARRPRPDHRHRIEHCGVLPEGMAARIARLGIAVVSQPGFLRDRGDRYLQLVPAEELSRLYAFRTLVEAGVLLAAGSDAPVSTPDPLAAVVAAQRRTSALGRPIGPEQAVDAAEALRWWTAHAAFVGFEEGTRGVLRPGALADFVALRVDPLTASPDALSADVVEAVWIGGERVEIA